MTNIVWGLFCNKHKKIIEVEHFFQKNTYLCYVKLN